MSKKLSKELNLISEDLKTSADQESKAAWKKLFDKLKDIEKQIDKVDERVMNLEYGARDELSKIKGIIRDMKEDILHPS